MAITTSFEWAAQPASTTLFLQSNPDAISLAGGGFFFVGQSTPAGTPGSDTSIDGVVYNAAGNVVLGPLFTSAGSVPRAAQLTDGNVAVVWQSAVTGSTHYAILNPASGVIVGDTDLGNGGGADITPDVAARPGGGFAISFVDTSFPDGDIGLLLLDNAGTLVANIMVDVSVDDFDQPVIAAHANGNIAMALQRTNGTNTEIWTAVFDANGNVVQALALFDSNGTVNSDPTIVATATGFALAYVDNAWGTGGNNVTVARLAADGGFIDWSPAFGTENVFDGRNAADPSLTVLSNGQLAVSFTDVTTADTDVIVTLIDQNTGAQLASANTGLGRALTNVQGNSAIAGFGLGRVGLVAEDTTAGGVLAFQTLAARRVITGDSLANTIIAQNDMDHRLVGDGGNDRLTGGTGFDVLDGGIGNDTLNGGAGIDTLIGGAGNDVYTVDENDDVITEVAGTAGGIDSVNSSAARFVMQNSAANVENGTIIGNGYELIGNSLNNTLTGSELDNQFNGLNGNDIIRGLGGADIIFGGEGLDQLFGGVGNDILIGENGNDKLFGDADNDELFGGAGNDTLDGGSGRDTMDGGAGNDRYLVDGNSGDVVSETGVGAAGGTDLVLVDTTGANGFLFVLGANIENAELTGNGTGQINGNDLNNKLTSRATAGSTGLHALLGGGGKDTLTGGAGRDLLQGGAGADVLTGGAGNDQFDFTVLETSAFKDTIKDFNSADDLFTLASGTFAGLASVAGTFLGSNPQVLAFGATATTADHRIIYNQATGNLSYDADGVGGQAQTLIAVLTNKPLLVANDFFIF